MKKMCYILIIRKKERNPLQKGELRTSLAPVGCNSPMGEIEGVGVTGAHPGTP